MAKSSFNPAQTSMFAQNRKARNFDGDTEETLAEKIILFLNTKGYRVWKQENRGVLNANSAAQKIAQYINNLQKNKIQLDAKEIQENVFTLISRSYMKASLGVRGVPDVIGYNKRTGLWICVEIKINSDELSEYQKQFIKDLKDAGGECYVAKSFQQFTDSWQNRNA